MYKDRGADIRERKTEIKRLEEETKRMVTHRRLRRRSSRESASSATWNSKRKNCGDFSVTQAGNGADEARRTAEEASCKDGRPPQYI